jgi:colanic acid biosynthesis protein WcaH
MFLEKETFKTVIASTPLVSIDLVITNLQGEALLGKRLNRPAQSYRFVPGGRILKDEFLSDAFVRLTTEEIGQAFNIEQATILGPYDHFYQDNVFSDCLLARQFQVRVM